MSQPLLIEIGVEELPAIPLLKELDNISTKWSKILKEESLESEFDFYYTPRRLVFSHKTFELKQADKTEELFGAPVAIAFKDGEPTPAALGFAKKCGVSMDELGRAEKGGKEVLYFKRKVAGLDSTILLPLMIERFVKSLSFGKSMRWGSNSESFIRPIRWLGVSLNHKIVDMELFGVSSSNVTYVHRQVSFDKQTYTQTDEFFKILKEGKVNLFADSRRQTILDQFDIIEADTKMSIEVDKDLLDEIVAITEHPVALLGTFSESFLELPSEVIITSMREHQRYFPVYNKGKLSNHFIVVSNAVTDDYSLIVSGNEKVLYPRLDDGLFFYNNDLKRGLVNDGLEKVVYMKGLGTLSDKLLREKSIALKLFESHQLTLLKEFNLDESAVKTLISRLFEVSKADLMSEMVYEFTELQGLIGFYYATKLGEDPLVATAIKEQYLPDGEGAELPSNPLSTLIALAVKLDALMGLFSIDQIPTGSRDPFALRRAATGIMHIAVENEIALNISDVINENSDLYDSFEREKLEHFFLERLYPLYDTNSSIVKAVLASGERDLLKLDQKIKALMSATSKDTFKELMSLFKRVANITKDMTLDKHQSIDETLLLEDAEKTLFSAFSEVENKSFNNYSDELDALFALAPKLSAFFDGVMVNAEDEKIKHNRKNLVANIYLSIRAIADIKEITI